MINYTTTTLDIKDRAGGGEGNVLVVSHVIILTIRKLFALRLGVLLSFSRGELWESANCPLWQNCLLTVPGLHVSLMSGNAHIPQNMDLSGRHASRI